MFYLSVSQNSQLHRLKETDLGLNRVYWKLTLILIVLMRQTGAFVFRVYLSLPPASGWDLNAVKLAFYFS